MADSMHTSWTRIKIQTCGIPISSKSFSPIRSNARRSISFFCICKERKKDKKEKMKMRRRRWKQRGEQLHAHVTSLPADPPPRLMTWSWMVRWVLLTIIIIHRFSYHMWRIASLCTQSIRGSNSTTMLDSLFSIFLVLKSDGQLKTYLC